MDGAALLLALAGCVEKGPRDTPPATTIQSLGLREIQSRRFDTSDEQKILSACAAELQDLGFQIQNTSPKLGLVVASKEGIANRFLREFLSGLRESVRQQFRACVVTRPTEDGKAIIVRVSFQRNIKDGQHQVVETQELDGSAQYQEFYQKLSQTVFLPANTL